MKSNYLVPGAIGLVIGGFVLLFMFAGQNPDVAADESLTEVTNEVARETCINHGGISMHIHPELTIYIEDQQVLIPANLGISSTCMKALHTHDETGKIHVEYPTEYEFVLGDFFANWGLPFNENEILDRKTDIGHEIVMTVNGEVSEEYENLVLRDLDQIVIRYQKTGSSEE